MIAKSALIAIAMLTPLSLQTDGLVKHIVRRHDNGKPYVVIYTAGAENERVKEELFFKNGQLDYRGHYKKGKEHGSWTYYWPNGHLKSEEYYERGLEEGISYQYNNEGDKVKELHYQKGKLLKEVLVKN